MKFFTKLFFAVISFLMFNCIHRDNETKHEAISLKKSNLWEVIIITSHLKDTLYGEFYFDKNYQFFYEENYSFNIFPKEKKDHVIFLNDFISAKTIEQEIQVVNSYLNNRFNEKNEIEMRIRPIGIYCYSPHNNFVDDFSYYDEQAFERMMKFRYPSNKTNNDTNIVPVFLHNYTIEVPLSVEDNKNEEDIKKEYYKRE
jgi:hypothetical protein